jgi:hypothetical protein
LSETSTSGWPMSQLGHSRLGRASSRCGHVRYVPKATDNCLRSTCREGPCAEVIYRFVARDCSERWAVFSERTAILAARKAVTKLPLGPAAMNQMPMRSSPRPTGHRNLKVTPS